MTAPSADPRILANVVAQAARRPRAARAILLDLDGTLAPIASHPDEVEVPREAVEGIDRLCGAGWRIAVVSGRAEESARRLVALPSVAVFGSHGLEGPWPERMRPRVPANLAARLERASRGLGALVSKEPGAWIESKPAGLALHFRAVTPERRASLRRALLARLETEDLHGLDVLEGKQVIELRFAGVHKGRVLDALGLGGPRRPDASLVVIGDDRTDEDLFRALGRRGLAIRVGPWRVVTAARLRLASPQGVARFLRYLAEALQRGAA